MHKKNPTLYTAVAAVYSTLTHLLERVWRTMQNSLTYLHTKVPNLAIIENIILYDV